MKTLLLIVNVLLFSISVDAQNVDEILDKYFKILGGEEAWSKLEGVKTSASVNQGGMEIPVYSYAFQDGKQLTKFSLQGQEVIQTAFDGENAWGINFMNMKAEPKTSEEVENMKREKGLFPDPFLNYKEKGYTCKLMGRETVEGVECYKIKLTMKPLLLNGVEVPNEAYYYFDPDHFVPIMREEEVKEGRAKGMISQEIFSDYIEVDGLFFPFAIDNKMKGFDGSQLFMIDKIELNPVVDDEIFSMPTE